MSNFIVHKCEKLLKNNDNGRIVIHKHDNFNWHIENEVKLNKVYYDNKNIEFCPWCGDKLE